MGYLEGGHWGTHWALTGVSLGSHWGLTGVSLGLAEPSELPRPSFGGDFLRMYFLHEIGTQTDTKSGNFWTTRRG